MIATWKIIVFGRVQGVGYRNAVYNFIHERTLNIRGHIRNLSNGRVEIILQGEPDEMRAVESFCSDGPALARVDHMEKIEINESETYSEFNIRY